MNENDEAAENQPQQKKITIEIPKELEAVYANVAFISHTPAEMVLDFAQVLPRMPRGQVLSRVIMSPMHAKLFYMALGQNIANYERQFGEIRLPPAMSLANQFFRFSRPGSEGDEGNNE